MSPGIKAVSTFLRIIRSTEHALSGRAVLRLPLYIINSSPTTKAELIECNVVFSPIRLFKWSLGVMQNNSFRLCFEPKTPCDDSSHLTACSCVIFVLQSLPPFPASLLHVLHVKMINTISRRVAIISLCKTHKILYKRINSALAEMAKCIDLRRCTPVPHCVLMHHKHLVFFGLCSNKNRERGGVISGAGGN